MSITRNDVARLAGVSSATAPVETEFAGALAATGQAVVCTVTLAGGVLVPPPLPVLPGTVGRGSEGGLETVTVAVPAALMFAAGMVAVICVAVIVAAVIVYGVNWSCDEPSVQLSVETCVLVGSLEAGTFMKFVPVTVMASGLPTTAQAGVTEVTVGVRLGGLLTIKVMVLERPLVPVP